MTYVYVIVCVCNYVFVDACTMTSHPLHIHTHMCTLKKERKIKKKGKKEKTVPEYMQACSHNLFYIWEDRYLSISLMFIHAIFFWKVKCQVWKVVKCINYILDGLFRAHSLYYAKCMVCLFILLIGLFFSPWVLPSQRLPGSWRTLRSCVCVYA